MLKKNLIAVAMLIVSDSSFCQKILNNSLDVALRKKSNKIFLQQTLNYSRLSYVSPTFCDLGNPKKWYILSADISPQFVIGGSWMKFPIHLTPRYVVRIFHNNESTGDKSLPVRTPSFMPGGTIYFPLKKNMNDETLNIRYLSFSFFHHSNGQDGNEFDSLKNINLYNGNFSTNFIEPAFHFRYRKNLPIPASYDCSEPKPNYYDFYGKVGLEKHLGTADSLRNTYGDYRINILMGLIRVINWCDQINKQQDGSTYYRERDRLVLNTTFIMGEREKPVNSLKHRINLDLKYHWRIPSSPNTSLFIGCGYYGSDTYNIYFMQKYFYVNAGLSLGFFVTPNMIGTR